MTRSNIEDLLIVATLLDKQNAQIDLRQEIDKLMSQSSDQPQQSTAAVKQLINGDPEFEARKLLKKAVLFFLNAGKLQSKVNKGASLTTDGEYLYFFNTKQGLFRLSTGNSQGSMIGQVY